MLGLSFLNSLFLFALAATALPIAYTLIPKRMREKQAEFDETGFEPTGDDAPGLEPLPEGGTLERVPELAPIPVRSEAGQGPASS